jgi:hypothetical protein
MSISTGIAIPEGFELPTAGRFDVSSDGTRAMLSQGENAGVFARFYEDSYKLTKASEAAGVPLHTTKLFVEIKCAYDPKNIHVHMVSEEEQDEWKIRFAEEYKMFLLQKEHAAIGQPILGWNELSPVEKANLTSFGIVTLEQLIESDVETLNKLTNGRGRELLEAAGAQLNFKAKLADVSKVAKELAGSKEELDGAKELIEKLTREKEALQNQLKGLKTKLIPPSSRAAADRQAREEKRIILEETAKRLEAEEAQTEG